MRAIQDHPVVIVSGETGSGKTTQLPKMALSLGRGRMNAAPGEKGKLIGHTQPRRIAATSVAKRIAQELDTPAGEVVGYKVRFNDQLGPNASIKLMTDGILLAETQGDPLLKAYDTIIIDEAHERSLNIDFLLGYLREILPRRPDLKIIVTSATIDSARFSKHFASAKGPAPIIQVSGRTFPVEVRYRPFEEQRDYGMNEAIADALDELWSNPHQSGDVLVFLPGEREIRDAADHLREHLRQQVTLSSAEVLPLFARLTPAEQERIFAPHSSRRVVLATNVAETSLTVPGIRYVIDSGLARVKRYSFRSKVEQLLVEPISQAAAAQRAGRCGRVADGICIRLFDQQDFTARAPFTDPEILRSSLAGVILRMKSLHLGDVERFAFLEPPRPKAITDGYQLLNELGAVNDEHELTPLGAQLSKLPLDPRVGRMILEAKTRGALHEVLIIAAALSVQDVRDRPMTAQGAADQAHAKFKDDRSEFSGYLTLWNWIATQRGDKPIAVQAAESEDSQADSVQDAQSPKTAVTPPHPLANKPVSISPQQRAIEKRILERQQSLAASKVIAVKAPAVGKRGQGGRAGTPGGATKAQGAQATQATQATQAGGAHVRLSVRQFESLLKQNFINVRRLREWRDVYTQLLTVVKDQGWRMNVNPASFEQLHLSLLSGLLGNIGYKPPEEEHYLGARGIKFYRHPGAQLRKKPGQWVVASEIMETTRVFGRGLANIEPKWLEELGAHLLKRQLLDPHWEKKTAQVTALERATLYGLVVYNGRKVPYSRVDLAGARQMFIREALVHGQWETPLEFLSANQRLVDNILDIEHKTRRQDVLVDDELIYAFYDEHLPAHVCSGHTLEKWYEEQLKPTTPPVPWGVQSKSTPASRERLPLLMTRDNLMRHQASSVTYTAFPPTVRLGGVDCAVQYLHEPGSPRDGMSITVPLFVLNQVQDERAEWLVPGMLKDKIQALLKTLPQKPRGRLVPLPHSAQALFEEMSQDEVFGAGSLMTALLKRVKARVDLDLKPTDFKTDMLSPHFWCHFVVVDEHGRQLAQGRNLGSLKAQLGSQARGAFQALAALKSRSTDAPGNPGLGAKHEDQEVHSIGALASKPPDPASSHRAHPTHHGAPQLIKAGLTQGATALDSATEWKTWGFGELPELMEIGKGAQSLIGYPALVDRLDHVVLEVFDEPHLAQSRHIHGLRRLFRLQLKDSIKYLEKNIPDATAMGFAFIQLFPKAKNEELFTQLLDVALERAFLMQPWPHDASSFESRLNEGRTRLNLIAQEVARLAQAILTAAQLAKKKLKDLKPPADVVLDIEGQLDRILSVQFLSLIPYSQWQHLPRYLKAIALRLDKYKSDPKRDQTKLLEIKPLEQRYWRWIADRRGQQDERSLEFRWLLEELRVSAFAQELKTPQPVSAKRLEKAWGLLIQ